MWLQFEPILLAVGRYFALSAHMWRYLLMQVASTPACQVRRGDRGPLRAKKNSFVGRLISYEAIGIL